MSEDLIRRSDAIKAIHNYWEKRLDTLPIKKSEYGEVYADIQQIDKILEHNKALCNFIKSIPSADRPQGEWKRVSADKYVQHAYHFYRCSKCGYDHIGKTNYCPNCGCRMKGADDE